MLAKKYIENYKGGGHIIVAESTPEGLKVKSETDLLYKTIPKSVKDFMPIGQQKVVQASIIEFQDVLERLEKIIKSMPVTYEQDGISLENKIAYLHYFSGGSDWWIFEKDKGSDDDKLQHQAFGYAVLGEDWQNAEMGYISIEEMKPTKVELDFHFEPTKFGEILKKYKEAEEDEITIQGKLQDERLHGQKIKKDSVVHKMGKHLKLKKAYGHGQVGDEVEVRNDFNPAHDETISVRCCGNDRVKEILKVRPEDVESDDYVEEILIDRFVVEVDDNKEFNKNDLSKFFVITKVGSRDSEGKVKTWHCVNKRTPEEKDLRREDFALLEDSEVRDFLSPKLIEAIQGDSGVAEPVSLNELTKGKNQHEINELIRNLVKKNGTDRLKYSPQELQLLESYEGSGGYAKEGEKGARLLDQFFTPDEIVKKMWGLAVKHGFKFETANILEPSAGVGRFLKYIPPFEPANVHTFEVDETSHAICKLLYPDYVHELKSFETLFVKGNRHVGLAGVSTFYDLVIGNPPYRKYVSPIAVLGEKEATGAETFDQYFIMRGVDVLKQGGLLVYIIPSSFMFNKLAYNDFKIALAKKCDLVEAYRLPSGVFGATDVTTDIIVLKKR